MKRTRPPRAPTLFGATLLVLSVFGACSSSNDSATSVFDGPPSISITKVVFAPGAGIGCGKSLDVTLSISDWLLREPGLCESAPQCGQVRVTLFQDGASAALAQKVSVSAAVDLSLDSDLEAGSYKVEAELIDDAGKVFTITDAGSSSAQESFVLNPAVDCAPASGAGSSEAGAGGFGGEQTYLGTAGSDEVIAGAGGA